MYRAFTAQEAKKASCLVKHQLATTAQLAQPSLLACLVPLVFGVLDCRATRCPARAQQALHAKLDQLLREEACVRRGVGQVGSQQGEHLAKLPRETTVRLVVLLRQESLVQSVTFAQVKQSK